MTKYSIAIILFLNLIFNSFGQEEKLVKNIQSWRVEVSREATEWVKKRNISSLESAEWKIKSDSTPALQIVRGEAIKRLLNDKRTVIKVNILNGTAPLVLDRDIIYKYVSLENSKYANQKLEEERKTILKNLRKNYSQLLPKLFDEKNWNSCLNDQSIDSILPSFKKYVTLAKSDSIILPRDSIRIAQKIAGIEATTAKSIEKSKKNYKEIVGITNFRSRKTQLPTIPWNFDISELVKSNPSWSATDITVSLERKDKVFMQIYFDTLRASILTDMPLADSTLCDGNFIENEIAMGNESKRFTPCGQLTGFDCYGKFAPAFWEKKRFVVKFDKNVTEDIKGSLDPAYEYLKSNKLELKKVSIHAYASIEGETEKNLVLASERAGVMVKVLQTYEKDTIDAEVISTENWKDFYKDLPKTPFAKWKTLDSLEIKTLVNDTVNSKKLEPWLKNHRYAELELLAQKKISSSEKMEKIKDQYRVYISNLNSASEDKRNFWQAKIASMRYWLVKEYMAGRIEKSYADSLFIDMTPELRMVNFYQQLKVLQSNKELLGTTPSLWMTGIIDAAIKRHESLDSLLQSGTLKNTKPTEMLDEAAMDFLRFSLLVTVNLVRKEKLPASIYDHIELPEKAEYVAFNAILDYAVNYKNLIVVDKKKKPVIKFSEHSNNYPEYTRQFALPTCNESYPDIYCIEHPCYYKLKAAILHPKKMTLGNKELFKKVTLIFLEVQITESNEWEGYYYDTDLDIFKVREMLEELHIPNLCPVQKDKVILEVNRKAALFLFRKSKKSKCSKELNAISSYYIRQKSFVNAELAERITRMLLWFDCTDNNSKNNLYNAQSFLKKMGVGTDKRYDSLIPLFDRINKLASKWTIMGEESSNVGEMGLREINCFN